MFMFVLIQTNTDCSTPPPKKETKSKDCGSATGSGVQADDFEWDFWDVSYNCIKRKDFSIR